MSTLKMAKKKCVEEDYDDEYDEEDEDDLATDEGKGPARGLCYSPSLNTQFCIKGLLVVWDFCFWAIWAAGPVREINLWVHFEQGIPIVTLYSYLSSKSNLKISYQTV